MSRVVIIVSYRIKPGSVAEFNEHIRAHAARTLADEPGCERFDVLQTLKADGTPEPTRMMLCEVYQDQAAFDAHRKSPRMVQIAERNANLLEERTLTICSMP